MNRRRGQRLLVRIPSNPADVAVECENVHHAATRCCAAERVNTEKQRGEQCGQQKRSSHKSPEHRAPQSFQSAVGTCNPERSPMGKRTRSMQVGEGMRSVFPCGRMVYPWPASQGPV